MIPDLSFKKLAESELNLELYVMTYISNQLIIHEI